jgi:nucleotide-binding universal stress UspA family protein
VIERILVAVDDSPPALEAARVAVALAAALGGRLLVVHVLVDSDVASTLEEAGGRGIVERRSRTADALFRHVQGVARTAGVESESVGLHGEPAHLILRQARTWPADLVVLGRGLERGVGGPYVGRVARIVLEYAEQPVLVVPASDALTP